MIKFGNNIRSKSDKLTNITNVELNLLRNYWNNLCSYGFDDQNKCLVSESWDRHPIGILAGNKYHLGIYDECVDVQSPVKGQYCLSEVKIMSSDGKDYSYNRTDDLLDFGNNTWHTLFGVSWIMFEKLSI